MNPDAGAYFSNRVPWDTGSPGRPARIFVDLDAIAGNVRYFVESVTPDTVVMAVVKADGYGHGAAVVAREAVAAGASSLAVATIDEGVALRTFGIEAPILVLGPIDPSEAATAVKSALTLTVSDARIVDVISEAARRGEKASPLPVHIKIDTGMNRFGASPETALDVCQAVVSRPELVLTGVYSHFADADNPDGTFSRAQAGVFDACLTEVRTAGISTGTVHLSNSAAALRSREWDHDMVRIGIALYGLAPAPGLPLPAELRPALSLRCRIAKLTDIQSGDSVSYGRTYVAEHQERVGLVPIGYADGYRRGLSGLGVMTAGEVSLPVRGRVCMDQTVVGIAPEATVSVGSDIDVISARPGAVNCVARIAETLGTIDYEVVTQLARRIPRYYTKGRRIEAVQNLHTVDLISNAS